MKIGKAKFKEVIKQCIKNNEPLTATPLQRTYFPNCTRQNVQDYLNRYRRDIKSDAVHFLSTREKARLLYDEGLTVKEVAVITNRTERSIQIYFKQFKTTEAAAL
ncbi:response regulator transcription factor [Buttiauxella noackiae]|uniref:response regulator transcription factor n=1 Tax=Buttiauxella noackiae TaxID=82992 RepID=UPI000555080B|nr:response regulator transcription factor [Buttiauxella noackiae]